jgi:glycosyltransferase involved in cell wall biosynthesis
LLQRKRPDVIVAMTRTHPAGSDDMINKNPLKRVIARVIARLDDKLRVAIARKAYWVDCVTQEQAAQLEKETGRRVEIVMNGVNTDLFKPISETRKAEVRADLGIPETAIVVGYCGGFPEQRGAKEISALSAIAPGIFGVVIGKLSDADRTNLAHDRVFLLGEIDYQKVPDLVGSFDVAVALDVPGRSGVAGNSNQKVRQGLASGAWILTQAADLPFEDKPHLGINVTSRKAEYLVETVHKAQQYFSMREERSAYARANLSTASIFQSRHDAILSGLRS